MYYLVENKKVIPCSEEDWDEWESSDGEVATYSMEAYIISTFFLGIDYEYKEDGNHLFFQTCIYNSDKGPFLFKKPEKNRYSTWEEAEEGHLEILKMYIETNPKSSRFLKPR